MARPQGQHTQNMQTRAYAQSQSYDADMLNGSAPQETLQPANAPQRKKGRQPRMTPEEKELAKIEKEEAKRQKQLQALKAKRESHEEKVRLAQEQENAVMEGRPIPRGKKVLRSAEKGQIVARLEPLPLGENGWNPYDNDYYSGDDNVSDLDRANAPEVRGKCAPPPWVEDTTLTERERSKRACRRCQKSKGKCDNQVPSCRPCVLDKVRCRYRDPFTGRQLQRGQLEAVEKGADRERKKNKELERKLDRAEKRSAGFEAQCALFRSILHQHKLYPSVGGACENGLPTFSTSYPSAAAAHQASVPSHPLLSHEIAFPYETQPRLPPTSVQSYVEQPTVQPEPSSLPQQLPTPPPPYLWGTPISSPTGQFPRPGPSATLVGITPVGNTSTSTSRCFAKRAVRSEEDDIEESWQQETKRMRLDSQSSVGLIKEKRLEYGNIPTSFRELHMPFTSCHDDSDDNEDCDEAEEEEDEEGEEDQAEEEEVMFPGVSFD